MGIASVPMAEIPAGNLALVLGRRQTLMTTYLYYQTLAYMGAARGAWMAALERGDRIVRKGRDNLIEILGGIEVQVESGHKWKTVGIDMEAGPIATEVTAIPLPYHDGGPLKLRLKLTQGLWRIDYLALAELEAEVEPLRLSPTTALYEGEEVHYVIAALENPDDFLITVQGDVYTLTFDIPDGDEDYEWFLESRGYYLEWSRRECLAEENPAALAGLLIRPRHMLRELAPAFQEVEPRMEKSFWDSRYERP